MKPIYLSIEGINSFTAKQEINFEALSSERIFCICGTTGSGKTTILDSIIIALFAPRSYTRGALKEYINTGAEKGEIVFRFEFEGGIYEVKRTLKPSGTGGVLKRLDTGETLADQTEKVTNKIEEMLNITCDDFTKIVILEQGKYNKFMVTGGDERNKFLAKLFNYSRFEGLKEKFRKLADNLEKIDKDYKDKIDALQGVTKGKIDEQERQKKELEKTAVELMNSQEILTQKRIDVTRQKGDYDAGVKARQELSSATAALQGLKSDKQKLNELNLQVEAHKTQVILLESACNAARENLVKINECKSDLQKKDALENARKIKLQEYLALDEKIKIILGKLQNEPRENLLAQKEKASVELEELRKNHAAADVAHLLAKGEKCPVCGGVYNGDFLFSEEAGRLKALDVIIKNIEQRLIKSQSYEVELATLREKIENIKGDGIRLKSEIDELSVKIENRLNGDDILLLEKRANSDIQEAREESEKGKKLIAEQSILVALLAGKEAEITEKIRAANEIIERVKSVSYDNGAYERIERERAKLEEDSKNNSAQIIQISTLINMDISRLAEKNKYKGEKEKIALRLSSALKLKKMFERNSFLEYVSREYIMGFTIDASIILGELTGGKYTLEYDATSKEFLVRDFLNNNETRKVKTLSGGETFLASLSVAIAISRSLADGKNYEFFFLDEGFGTLHERAIETVCEALKKLSESTIVGLVSHRQELTEQISAKIVVSEATEENGSTINFVCG